MKIAKWAILLAALDAALYRPVSHVSEWAVCRLEPTCLYCTREIIERYGPPIQPPPIKYEYR